MNNNNRLNLFLIFLDDSHGDVFNLFSLFLSSFSLLLSSFFHLCLSYLFSTLSDAGEAKPSISLHLHLETATLLVLGDIVLQLFRGLTLIFDKAHCEFFVEAKCIVG